MVKGAVRKSFQSSNIKGDFTMNDTTQLNARYASQIGVQAFGSLDAGMWATYDPQQPTKAGELAKIFFKDGRTLLCKVTEILRAGYSAVAGGAPISVSAVDVAYMHRLVTIHAGGGR